MSQSANGRDVLGLAREVVGEVDVGEGSRGSVNEINGLNEQTVHDPRVLRALERIAAQQTEVRGLLVEVVGLLRRKL